MKVTLPVVGVRVTVAALPSVSLVPVSVALPAPLASLRVMLVLYPVSVVPLASTARTTGTVVNAVLTVLLSVVGTGWVENTSRVATTSEVTVLASTVARLEPTPS